MPQKKEEIIELDSLSQKNNTFKVIERIRAENKEKRLNLHNLVTHLLAFIIIVPFLVMVIFSIPVPTVYSTIVSIVVGFYFAKSLF
jgi:hypothetical protein